MNSSTVVYIGLFFAQMWFLAVVLIMQNKIKRVAESTHIIVNSQRTMLLRLIATLSQRIADENPLDKKAQDAAEHAGRDAESSDHPRRVPI